MGDTMSDEGKRLAIVALLEPYLDDRDCYEPTPLVPLELYFEGNDDEGSLGCNLAKHPGISAFYETLLKLRKADQVSGVWVIVKQHDWKPGWPHSDEILVRTTLADSEVAAWFEHLGPDEVGEARGVGPTHDVSGAPVACAAGERHVVVWWD
jgi:hypothetical protein